MVASSASHSAVSHAIQVGVAWQFSAHILPADSAGGFHAHTLTSTGASEAYHVPLCLQIINISPINMSTSFLQDRVFQWALVKPSELLIT